MIDRFIMRCIVWYLERSPSFSRAFARRIGWQLGNDELYVPHRWRETE